MASVKKFTDKAVRQMLRHNAREIAKPSNKDIDPTRSHANYKLSPDWRFLNKQQTDYERYKFRMSQLHRYNRADVKTLAGWVVTVPKDLPKEYHAAFFRETYTFLENRYGRSNTIQAIVHNDESTPHLHYLFIPAVADKKNRGLTGEKVCANEVLTRQELREFHPALQKHMNQAGIPAQILNGTTAAGNRTVKELKKERDAAHRQHEPTRERRGQGVFIR